MDDALATGWPVAIGVTGIVMGFGALMTGRAIANTWRPAWQVVAYCLLLGMVDRFLIFALFKGPLLSPAAYLVDSFWLVAVGLFVHGIVRADRMVRQYPWLYERKGLFGWRDKG